MTGLWRWKAAIAGTLVILVLGSCGLFGYLGEPDEIVLWGDEFVLNWDPAAQSPGSIPIERYSLYYRPYPSFFDGDWIELGTVPAGQTTTFHVDGSDLAPGTYEFAVRSRDANGAYSDYHRSTDWEAHPATGWYLNWLGGNP